MDLIPYRRAGMEEGVGMSPMDWSFIIAAKILISHSAQVWDDSEAIATATATIIKGGTGYKSS